MQVKMDMLFRSEAGYDQLVERLQSNPKFVFHRLGQAGTQEDERRGRPAQARWRVLVRCKRQA